MVRERLEVADIVRVHREDFTAYREGRVSAAERRVLNDIAACRTATLGGHVEQCETCGHSRIAYNSCRNRHCPKCQKRARVEWLAARQQELLPVEYFHVVFTLPHELAPIAMQNKKLVYDILFRACAEALREIAADPAHLGAEIGFLAVLHTWGQDLDLHPHLHCVVPGGGLAPDGSRWVPCKPGFFLPVRALGRLFRGKFLHHLRKAHEESRLEFHGRMSSLRETTAFRAYLRPLYEADWVVYSKPPFAGPAQVLNYLARYTHRVAIANGRLISIERGKVRFHWKDYRKNGRRGEMTLDATEFLRRFLLHILPDGFKRIRHYGLMANRGRREKLDRCRELLAQPGDTTPATTETTQSDETDYCPKCKRGRMVCVLRFDPGTAPPEWQDSS